MRSLLPLLALAPGLAAADPPAFRGAEGFGAGVTGGRGGRVVFVTTLAESGPGSLKAALEASGPRIVVFRVSGVIDLGPPNANDVFDESDQSNLLVIRHGDVTIAGQTAPGAGITIRGRLYADYDRAVDNVILRFVRVRAPAWTGPTGDGEQYDALRFSLNDRVIVDHVSVSGGVDENFDAYENRDVSVQWSIFGAAATAGHPEGAHNYGLLNDGGRISVHHNLFTHESNRNPALGEGPAEAINNVVYNVRHGFVHHNDAVGAFVLVGNTYLRGPASVLIPFYFDDENPGQASYFLAGNYVSDPPEFEGLVDNPWQEGGGYFGDLAAPESARTTTRPTFSGGGYVPVSEDAALVARDRVLTQAGALPHDVIDRGLLAELMAGTGGYGGRYPADLMAGLTPTPPPTDADQDGMADDWELSHGLAPNVDDHAQLMPSGVSAIEDYLDDVADTVLGIGPPPPTDAGVADGTTADAADAGVPDAATAADAATSDGGPTDATARDAGRRDAAAPDGAPRDSGAGDAGRRDAGAADATARDAGSPTDADPLDADPLDAGTRVEDAGATVDAGTRVGDAGATVDAAPPDVSAPSDAGGPSDASAPADAGATPDEGGCGCAAAPRAQGSPAPLLALAALVLLGRRPRGTGGSSARRGCTRRPRTPE